VGWVAALSEQSALEAAKRKFGLAPEPDGCAADDDMYVRRDSDVLDTWFSSGLLPISALNWPWVRIRSRLLSSFFIHFQFIFFFFFLQRDDIVYS
jgi:valyl-tRNA synthetase